MLLRKGGIHSSRPDEGALNGGQAMGALEHGAGSLAHSHIDYCLGLI